MFEMKYFKKGQVIMEDGATEETAYLIQSGSVEVYKAEKNRKIVLAKLGVGNVIGEMGLITGEPRSASVAALEDTGVNVIDREGFEAMLNTDPRSIFPILKEAFRKLSYMNQIAVAFYDTSSSEVEPKTVEAKNIIQLRALSQEAERALQRKAFEITKVPFYIGRATKDSVFETVDLKLLDREPYELSRSHCFLACVREKYYLVDPASTLGTTVDGVRIGKREAKKNAPLEKGCHRITMGSPRSPYTFELEIPG
jgi:CRP-like cAMP-binding protein